MKRKTPKHPAPGFLVVGQGMSSYLMNITALVLVTLFVFS